MLCPFVKVFLTGGSGLLGSHVAAQLRARSDRVTALVRPGSDVSFLRAIGVETLTGDVNNSVRQLADKMRGCDAVVHAAAFSYGDTPDAEYQQVNVIGTERIVRAGGAAGARLTVVISSIAAYGPIRRVVREDDRFVDEIPRVNSYARTKRESEEVARALHADGVAPVTIVRPGIMYGERDRSVTPRIARLLKWRVLPLPGGGRTTVPVVYAGNVATGVVRVLDRPQSAGTVFNLSGDAGLSLRTLLLAFGRSLDREPVLVSIPASLSTVAAAFGELLSHAGPALARSGVRRAVWLALNDNPFDCANAVRDLDWRRVGISADEAIERTAYWWRTEQQAAA